MEQQQQGMATRFVGFVALYGFWSVAVLSRAVSQYLTHPAVGIPTHISLLAGLIYVAITVCAWHGLLRPVRIGLWIEVVGVVVVSIAEEFRPLPYVSAWSNYGAGYLWLPIILPIAGLILAYRNARTGIHHGV
jgi:hypothetical protein